MPYNSCRTCLTYHMLSISCHIMPLVINSPRGGYSHTHKHTHIQTSAQKQFYWNQYFLAFIFNTWNRPWCHHRASYFAMQEVRKFTQGTFFIFELMFMKKNKAFSWFKSMKQKEHLFIVFHGWLPDSLLHLHRPL